MRALQVWPSRGVVVLGAIGLVVSVLAVACTSAAPAAKKRNDTVNPGSFPSGGDDTGYQPPRPPDYENDDSGLFAVGEGANDGGPLRDAALEPQADGDVADAAPAPCATPLAPGDLAVVE